MMGWLGGGGAMDDRDDNDLVQPHLQKIGINHVCTQNNLIVDIILGYNTQYVAQH